MLLFDAISCFYIRNLIKQIGEFTEVICLWWKKKKYSYDDNFRDDEVEDLENGKNVDSDDDDD